MTELHGLFLDSEQRDFPCKLFHTTGNCVNGDDCMFSHEPLTDDTQELLDKVSLFIADGKKHNRLSSPFLTLDINC